MEIYTDQPARLVRPVGKIDTVTSGELDASLLAFTASEEDIILDLSQCTYISSAGIRVLIKTKKQLQKQQKELYLTGLVPGVMQVLEMAGLHTMFAIADSVEKVQEIVHARRKNTRTQFSSGNREWVFQQQESKLQQARVENKEQLLSFSELGFSLGYGVLAEAETADIEQYGLFVTASNVYVVAPTNSEQEEDFRIVSDVKRSGVHVAEAVSFGGNATGLLTLDDNSSTTVKDIANAALQASAKINDKENTVLMVVTGSLGEEFFTCICMPESPDFKRIKTSFGLNSLQSIQSGELTGITILHGEPEQNPASVSLSEFINQNLTYENILGVTRLNGNAPVHAANAWIFIADRSAAGSDNRLHIEHDKDMPFETYKAFLTRQLYTDSAKVIVHALHGGFSAQTFNVVSFDSEGRKLRPTVLKIAHKNLISREAERCRNYALPYIFNNSAVVLGNEFIGNTGALRYNFVGIGGESSSLKWLTHYYHDWDMEKLAPLFDKIFVQILKPWYGQPVKKDIMPFRDHDPTATFFPYIYDTVSELLGISAESKTISVQEFEQPALNPYWFLKHEYKRRSDETLEYYTGVCHGDLNMQNILLDETMNVYLIDFSETRPRSVISDFARLEAIFLVDNAPVENEDDMRAYVSFIKEFYKPGTLDKMPGVHYTGRHQQKVLKNAALTLKMRQYALDSVKGATEMEPYYIALLEWVLPIVCYTVPLPVRKLSMLVSSVLCENLLKE